MAYENTTYLFIIILLAKIFHAISTLFGTNLIIFKKFNENLVINISMLILNIILAYILYLSFGLIGVAFASLCSLLIRYYLLISLNKKIMKKN